MTNAYNYSSTDLAGVTTMVFLQQIQNLKINQIIGALKKFVHKEKRSIFAVH
jgi:hypothetical protein